MLKLQDIFADDVGYIHFVNKNEKIFYDMGYFLFLLVLHIHDIRHMGID